MNVDGMTELKKPPFYNNNKILIKARISSGFKTTGYKFDGK